MPHSGSSRKVRSRLPQSVVVVIADYRQLTAWHRLQRFGMDRSESAESNDSPTDDVHDVMLGAFQAASMHVVFIDCADHTAMVFTEFPQSSSPLPVYA